MCNKVKSVWLLIDHPMNIITAVGLAFYLQEKFEVNLLISMHPYWEGIDLEMLKRYFKQIYTFPNVGFSKHILREVKKIYQTKKRIKEIGIVVDDTFVVLSCGSFLENIVLSTFPENRRLSINPDFVYNFFTDKSGDLQYRENAISKIWNLTILPLFGLLPMSYYEHVSEKKLYDVDYKVGREKIFNKCFSVKNIASSCLEENEIYDLSIYVKNKIVTHDVSGEKKIIFFLGDSEVPDKYRIEFTNRCLRYIEKFFPNYSYVYKPHPNDSGEAESVDLGKFMVYSKKGVSQLFFLENLEKIHRCFTIGSTAVKFGINFGIHSYLFLDLYKNFSKDYYEVLKSQACDIDDGAFIKTFDSPPVEYKIDVDLQKVSNHLVKILKYLC